MKLYNVYSIKIDPNNLFLHYVLPKFIPERLRSGLIFEWCPMQMLNLEFLEVQNGSSI